MFGEHFRRHLAQVSIYECEHALLVCISNSVVQTAGETKKTEEDRRRERERDMRLEEEKADRNHKLRVPRMSTNTIKLGFNSLETGV
jgi:hypothetical protein